MKNKERLPESRKNLRDKINVSMNLGCLGLAQVLKGTVVATFPNLLPIFFSVQFFGSTLQGSISDIYRRSLVLNSALSILILATSVLVFTIGSQNSTMRIIQIACTILIGLGGNSDVVGRASIIDIHFHMTRRKVMSWTVFAEAFSWIIIGVLIRYFQLSSVYILILCICLASILLLTSLIFNEDKTTDKKHLHNTIHELSLVIKRHSKKLFFITLIVLTGELSYFFFFYAEENGIANKVLLADTYLSWFIGMSLGCVIPMKMKRFSDYHYCLIGLLLTFLGVLLFLTDIRTINITKDFYYSSFIFSLAGLGSGIFLPGFYSLISRGYSIHFQGILTGWIDSIRVFGDAFSTISLFALAKLSVSAPIFVSGFLALTSSILLILTRKHIETDVASQ